MCARSGTAHPVAGACAAGAPVAGRGGGQEGPAARRGGRPSAVTHRMGSRTHRPAHGGVVHGRGSQPPCVPASAPTQHRCDHLLLSHQNPSRSMMPAEPGTPQAAPPGEADTLHNGYPGVTLFRNDNPYPSHTDHHSAQASARPPPRSRTRSQRPPQLRASRAQHQNPQCAQASARRPAGVPVANGHPRPRASRARHQKPQCSGVRTSPRRRTRSQRSPQAKGVSCPTSEAAVNPSKPAGRRADAP